MSDVNPLLEFLSRGPATRAKIQATLGGSQPTLARALARASGRVARLGRGRATRYALRRSIRELHDLPVYRVDGEGGIHAIGNLAPIQPEGLWYDDREGGRGEIFAGLPWFLADMRPQGFLGRLFAARCRQRGLPERLADWNDEHVLYALATLGEDQPGNLILGTDSHERWQVLRRQGPRAITSATRGAQFRGRVATVLAGELPGSSVGGEQQKFGAAIQEENGELRHYIVKFSPPYREAAGRRWADLLVWEHLAQEAIRAAADVIVEDKMSPALAPGAAGRAAAETILFDDGERIYLQVARFDRIGMHGRKGIVSFGSLDDAFVGQRRSWSASAEALSRLGWITPEDAGRAAWLEAFGRLIANTDMHFGNLSVLHEGEKPLALSPAYDMLPMAYTPRATGEMLDATLAPPALPPQAQPQASEVINAAVGFWRAAADDARVSSNGHDIARRNAEAVARLMEQR